MHTFRSRALTRRTLVRSVFPHNALEKSRTLILDLSPQRLSLEEAATVAFNCRTLCTRYNAKRDLLMLEFDSHREKLAYLKRLPQWLWNRGCVVFEFSSAQLELWRTEAANS